MAGGLLRAYRAYRAAGADPPFGHPERAHGTGFEGYYWRIVQPASGAVVVALAAVCRGANGPWGLATLAAHPGGFVRSAVDGAALADARWFGVRVGAALRGSADALAVDLGPGAALDVTLHDAVAWPRRPFGALGPAHALPGLPQYWQPVVLAARVRGSARVGEAVIALDGATAYVEKNWGRAFPAHWWWGHAGAFPDADVSVSFAGGRVALLGAPAAPSAVVLRLGGRVLALAPPAARTHVALADGRWRLRTRAPGLTLELDGEADPAAAHELAVPVPDERRTEPRSHQQLAGRLALCVRRGRRILYRGSSELAGLEREAPLNPPPPAAPRR